jgi:hypothetical protein
MNRSFGKRDDPPPRPFTFRAAEKLGAFELAQLWPTARLGLSTSGPSMTSYPNSPSCPRSRRSSADGSPLRFTARSWLVLDSKQ